MIRSTFFLLPVVVLALVVLLLVVLPHVATAQSVKVIEQVAYRDKTTGKYVFRKVKAPTPSNTEQYCYLFYNYSMNVTGWDVARITASLDALKKDPLGAYYSCGYIEGYFTWVGILSSNYSSTPKLQNTTRRWVEENMQYLQTYAQEAVDNITKKKILAMPQLGPNGENSDAVMKHAAARSNQQIQGLLDGINQAIIDNKSTAQRWTLYDAWILNLQTELDQIAMAADLQYGQKATTQDPNHDIGLWRRRANAQSNNDDNNNNNYDDEHQLHGVRKHFMSKTVPGLRIPRYDDNHCSAITKIVDGDIFISHNTWSSYNLLWRQFKTYDFEISVSISGYNGFLFSVDDWMQSGHKLVVMETTNDQDNESLAEKYTVSDGTVPYWIRVMAATRFADSGKKWIQLFLTQNNGCYCNQMQILDFKLIQKKHLYRGADGNYQLPPWTFSIVEQMPGPFSAWGDLTQNINKHTYHPSYNIPYFRDIYKESGDYSLYKFYGDFFSYTSYARAEIFKREQGSVKGLSDVQRLMRLNKWQTDPLSRITNCTGCSPANSPHLTIANRADLVPSNAVFGDLDKDAAGFYSLGGWGAIDVKITSWKLSNMDATSSEAFSSHSAAFVNGPTNDDQPTFAWSKSAPSVQKTLHIGQPDVFDFSWTTQSRTELRLGDSAKKYFNDKNKVSPLPLPAVGGSSVGKNVGYFFAGLAGLLVAGGVLYFLMYSDWSDRTFKKGKKRAVGGEATNPGDVFEAETGSGSSAYRQMSETEAKISEV